MNNEKETFRTSDYGLAAYLAFKGMTLLGAVGRPDEYRKHFVFIDDEDRPKYVEMWASRENEEARMLVRYHQKTVMVKRALKDAKDIR